MCERPPFMGALIAGTNGGTIGYTEMIIQEQSPPLKSHETGIPDRAPKRPTLKISTIAGTTGTEFKIQVTLTDGRIEESYWDSNGCHICGNLPPPISNPQFQWAR